MLRLSSQLANERDPAEIVERLSEVTRSFLGVDICSIFLHDAKRRELCSFVQQKSESEIRFSDDKGIAGHVFHTQQPMIINDPYSDPRFNPEVDKQTQYKTNTIMALPIVGKNGKTLGVVEAINKLDGSPFAETDLEQLRHLHVYISAFTANYLLYTQLEQTQEALISKLAELSRLKDKETYNHTMRVGHYSALLAGAIGEDAEFVRLIGLAAPMHDIGKVGIPDAIICKPGRLTDEEYTEMQAHTLNGYKILLVDKDSALTEMAAVIALEHHEHWNGQGYPKRKKGQEISLCARITSIADAFDTMTSRRSYKQAKTFEFAFGEIANHLASQFDPDLGRTFVDLEPGIREIRSQFPDEI